MYINFEIDENNRLLNVTTFPVDMSKPFLEVQEGFFTHPVNEYIYDEGMLKYSPLPDPEPTIADQVAQLKQKLAETDYVVIKIAEGAATKEEYADVIAQRVEWRERINELENSLVTE